MNELIEIFGYVPYCITYKEGKTLMLSIGISSKYSEVPKRWSLCIKEIRLKK
jgi:hypothetical protein